MAARPERLEDWGARSAPARRIGHRHARTCGPRDVWVMGSPTRERDAVELVKLCQELWPRVISRTDFRDARLQSAEEREELLATALAWVWEYRGSLEGLGRSDLEARLCTMLYWGAIKRAREVTGTTDSHSRRRVQESPIDLGVIEHERDHGAMDLLHARAQRAF